MERKENTQRLSIRDRFFRLLAYSVFFAKKKRETCGSAWLSSAQQQTAKQQVATQNVVLAVTTGDSGARGAFAQSAWAAPFTQTAGRMEQDRVRGGMVVHENDQTTTPSTEFRVTLQQSDVDPRLLALLTNMPLSRVIDAFACARCASDGPAACLDDLGHHGRRTNQKAPSVYSDRSLLGQCIRALVPVEAIFAAVDAAVRSGRGADRRWARVYNDNNADAQHKESSGSSLRLCTPTERDLTRLAAWTWTEVVSADHSPLWKSACCASAQCWHAAAYLPSSLGYASVLGIRTIDERCCSSQHAFEAAWLARNLERCQEAHTRKEVERMQHPCDARIFAFSKHRSLDSRGCYTYIDGDPLFIIIADW